MPGHRPSQKHLAIVFAVGQRSQPFGQSPLGHHIAGDVGGAFDVVLRAGGDEIRPEHDGLGDPSTEQAGNLALQPLLAEAVAVTLRQKHGHAQRPAARDDADLVYRVVRRHQPSDDGMAGLVIGRELLFLLAHHHRLALGAHHDLVLGLLEILHVHIALVGASGEQRRLIHQIGQVRPGKTGSATGDHHRFDIVGQRHLAHMDLENLLATPYVGQRDHHLPIETARTQQCRIEHIGTIGGGDDDDAFVTLEAVHFHQQLVQGLLALVVTATQTRAAMPAHGVDFVDEDNAGRVLLGLFEHIAHPGCADTDEHLHEVRTGDGKERHLGLAGDGLGQQRLAGTGRTDHQHPARNLAPKFLEFAGITQEFHQFSDFFLGLVHASDIRERDLDLILAHHPGTRLTERHRPSTSATSLHLPQEEHPDPDQ